MKNLYLVWLLLLVIGCQPSVIKTVQQEIDTISSQWVPDNREGICNVLAYSGKQGKVILKGETIYNEARQEIIVSIKEKGYEVVDSIVVLPDTLVNSKNWGVVTLSIANMRRTPRHSSEMLSQTIMGTPVRILKKKGSWYLIQTPDSYIAWTNESAVQAFSRAAYESWKQSDRVIFLSNAGYVFKTKQRKEVVCDLVAGSILEVLGSEGECCKVQLPDNRSGYIAKGEVKDFSVWQQEVNLNQAQLCHDASRFMGLPYQWGGTSSKALDCSGFVKTVYYLNGTILARDASLQFRHGEKIDISNGYDLLQKGDLLYFGQQSPLKVTHVGMYIGDSEFIHEAGRVKINSLDSTRANFSHYRTISLLGARRIIGQASQKGLVTVTNHEWY
ncbi:glycoside hydrolase [Marinilabiliaceae bacterium JC017]|nr:glycoside hydrolase [Marinilabiliaceae bacterium JC017]